RCRTAVSRPMAPPDQEGHVQLQLGAYVLGGLSATEEAAVRAHLDTCAQCRVEHEELTCVPSWLDLLRPDPADAGPRVPLDGEGYHDPGRAPGRPDDEGGPPAGPF
ncbi:MAG TPA: zf-HC2 domain-containing protein, partial [Streptosporangiaceae bacterium]|nr:zf-HC2 domain-containing protein [Streptosporangiaceae bacterium]